MSTAKKTTRKHLGEYCPGSSQSSPVYDVYTVPGKVREIKRLWAKLDDCDAIDQISIVSRLIELGAAVRQS
jgi:hypothetical protein